MRILVTGITGFAGGHLAEALLARGDVELFGVSRRARWPAGWEHLAGRAELLAADLTDGAAALEVVQWVRPEQVYHLAGYAHVGASFQHAEDAWAANLTATRRLYDAVARWGGRPRLLYVSSGLVYGDPEDPGQALDERCALRPASPYAASKAAADLVSYQYTRAPGLDIVRARPFNHIGPRQSPEYAVAHFARQLAAIEAGRQPPLLETGNLRPLRDLSDVRDIVQAYLVIMEQGRTGAVYNVASGEAHSMQDVLDRLLGLTRVRVEVRQKPDLVRATETAATRGDAGQLRQETGWLPQFSLDQTLADTLAYWRSRPDHSGERPS
jgi:GDP-4-dehydro-6-deoxy-D-mannose reductase